MSSATRSRGREWTSPGWSSSHREHVTERTPYSETLVVATSNRGKIEELRALVAGTQLGYVRAASELLGESPNIVEDGATFVDNAVKKARAVARATMTLTLADDSGPRGGGRALDGAPGCAERTASPTIAPPTPRTTRRCSPRSVRSASLRTFQARGSPRAPDAP